MTIKKPVKTHPRTEAAADAFIAAAPDAKPAIEVQPPPSTVGVFRGKKRIITLGLDPTLLDLVDANAAALHVSRAAFINMAITEACTRRAVESSK